MENKYCRIIRSQSDDSKSQSDVILRVEFYDRFGPDFTSITTNIFHIDKNIDFNDENSLKYIGGIEKKMNDYNCYFIHSFKNFIQDIIKRNN